MNEFNKMYIPAAELEMGRYPSTTLEDYVTKAVQLCFEKCLDYTNIKVLISHKYYISVIADLKERLGGIVDITSANGILVKFCGVTIEQTIGLKEEIGAVIQYGE